MNIEIKSTVNDKNTKEYYLSVNGIDYAENTSAYLFRGEKLAAVHLYGDAYCILDEFKLSDLNDYLNRISMRCGFDWNEHIDEIVYCSKNYSSDEISLLKFNFEFDLENWRNPWSISEYFETLSEIVHERNINGLNVYRDEDSIINDCGLECEITDFNKTLLDILLEWQPVIVDVFNSLEQRLKERSKTNTLTTLFKFPDEIAVACEQYLVYFGQFLADLGIFAKVDITHQAHETLFNVTPDNPTEALENIRVALDTYLSLSHNRDFHARSLHSSDVAILQLKANLSHFEAQLNLARALIETKDATIEALKISNFMLKQNAVGMSSLEDGTNQSSKTSTLKSVETESVIDGILSVKNTEIKGVVIHTAELVRRLKRRFK